MLAALDQIKFEDKMTGYESFIRLEIVYSGPSRMSGGIWISMVERMVCKLEAGKSFK